ncbi:MAG: hypothetical protein ACLVH9_08065 [Fusobacterium sp.]|uniref:hypothetical protein n=1 Tax=Fusobacterium sp. TaxID=68766 RepID=UPI0025D007D4|nr:hypothetical protein [uncultured Fusobacterium sp.]
MKKVFLVIIFFVTNVIAMSLNFSVSPTKFKVDLSKDNIYEVYLLNNTSKPLRIEAYTEVPKGYEENNLNENIIIYPKKISIKPGGKKEIRFKVRSRVNVDKKRFKTFLVFRESLPNIKEKSEKSDGKIDMELSFITEIAIGVYGE